MREIKFRYRHQSIATGYIATDIFTLKDIKNGTVMDSKYWKELSCDEYTGLKDKNDKEIYEGDIIEFDKYEWYRSPIRSRSDIDCLPVYREEISMNHEGVSRSKSDLEQYCEVIGNIYEHPNLLKGE